MIDELQRSTSRRPSEGAARGVRVVHFTSVHPAVDFRIMRECTALTRAGYDVTIVGAHPKDETIDGVRIVPISRPRNRIERMTTTMSHVFSKARALDADIYHFHDPELIFAGLALRSLGKCVIYDAHEDLPNQVMSKDWLPAPCRPIISGAMHALIRTTGGGFSGVVAAWPNILERFSNRQTALVQNFAEPGEFAIAPTEFIPFRQRSNTALYCGSLMPTRGVREMVRAMRSDVLPEDTVLKIAGTFDDAEMEREVREAEPTGRVEYVGWADRAKYRQLLKTTRVGLSVAHPTPAYLETLSTKVYDYLSAGVPVVISHFPRWREIVDEYGCGIAVDPLNPDAIAAAVAELLADPDRAEEMGRRGRRAIEERYNWDNEAAALLDLYGRLERKTASR